MCRERIGRFLAVLLLSSTFLIWSAMPTGAVNIFIRGCTTYIEFGSYQADYWNEGRFVSSTYGWTGVVRTSSALITASNHICAARNGHSVEASLIMAGRDQNLNVKPVCFANMVTSPTGLAVLNGHCPDDNTYWNMGYLQGNRAWFTGVPKDDQDMKWISFV